MKCRPGCGACSIAPSISSAIAGMPDGKPASVRCVQLDDNNRCLICGRLERPAICCRLLPTVEMCGDSASAALTWLTQLESTTKPQESDQEVPECQIDDRRPTGDGIPCGMNGRASPQHRPAATLISIDTEDPQWISPH